MVLAIIGLWIGVAFFTGTLRGRQRALSAAGLMSVGLWAGSGMVAVVWTPQARHPATMPAWGELSRGTLLDIAILGFFGLAIILCYSFLGSKKE